MYAPYLMKVTDPSIFESGRSLPKSLNVESNYKKSKSTI